VSSPSDPQPPAAPAGSGQPSTQEIPVVQPSDATPAPKQLPPHPDAAPPTPVPVDAPQPTGPVDFVPGLPGLGTPPVPPPAAVTAAPPPPVPPRPVPVTPGTVTPGTAAPTTAFAPAAGPTWPDSLDADEPAGAPKERRTRVPRDRSTLAGLGLVLLSVVTLELGLTLGFGAESYWSLLPLWSGFATVCAVLALLAFAAFYPAGNRLRSGPTWRVAAGGLVGLAVFWLLVVLPVVDSDRGFVLTASLAALGGALWIGPRSKA
jgi:hypothetical protein